MTWEMLFVFGLVAATFAMMVWEKFPPDVVSLVAFSGLLVAGILTPKEAFQVFSNDAVITVACMFVLSAALERTGVIEAMGRRLNKLAGKNEGLLLLVTLPLVALVSAFVNNTPVVVVFLPILISISAARNLKPSKLLMPLSFASILGGTCTLLGTSTNILVSSTAQHLGQPPLGILELAKVGVPLTVVGLIYLLTIGRRFLPARETLASILQSTQSKQYLTEVVVVAESPLIGKALLNTPLANQPKARVLEVMRGGATLDVPLDEVILERGDCLRLATALSSVVEINNLAGVEIEEKAKLAVEMTGSQKAVVAECIIGPSSSLQGHSIRQVNFRRRYGVLVLAVHRKGVNLRTNFAEVTLQYGDTLLVEGPEPTMNELRESRDFLLLLDVPHSPKRPGKQWIAVTALAAVVVLGALQLMPISALALLGAVAVVLFGCLEMEEAYQSVEWKILFLIFGMLALGFALEKTGGAEFISRGIIGSVGSLGAPVVLSAIILMASLLTNFLSNNAVAVLITPIAIQTALHLQVNPRPFIIAVVIGASACLATPIGYQTNTLVYGAGGYYFRDFIKVGLPLNILIWILASFLIPLLWPFAVH